MLSIKLKKLDNTHLDSPNEVRKKNKNPNRLLHTHPPPHPQPKVTSRPLPSLSSYPTSPCHSYELPFHTSPHDAATHSQLSQSSIPIPSPTRSHVHTHPHSNVPAHHDTSCSSHPPISPNSHTQPVPSPLVNFLLSFVYIFL